MCCEEAGTDKACLLLVPASSQHKAAPTKDASDERYLFSARQRSPKGLGNLPQGNALVQATRSVVGAALCRERAAKQPLISAALQILLGLLLKGVCMIRKNKTP